MPPRISRDRLSWAKLPLPALLAKSLIQRASFVPARKPYILGITIFTLVAAFIVAIPPNFSHPTPEDNSLPATQAVEIAQEVQIAETGEVAEVGEIAEEDNSSATTPGHDLASREENLDNAQGPPQETDTASVQEPPQKEPAAREQASAGKTDQPIKATRGGNQPRRGIVVIDPGHGGKGDVGANRTFSDGYVMNESDLNLKVSLALASLLKNEGFQVILTRETDTAVNASVKDRTGDGRASSGDELQARIDIANSAKADLFVSVHFNAAANQQGGTEVFYCGDRPFSDNSKKMAEFLQDSLLKGIRSLGYESPNRGVKLDTLSAARTHLYVLGPKTSTIAKPINMPSILGEALFISNVAEGNLLRNEKTLKTIAEAYFEAVVRYFDWLEY